MNEEEKERLIKKDILSIENRVRHAFNQGYELGLKERKNTCEDAVSRQAVLDEISDYNNDLDYTIDALYDMVKRMSSVNPQPCEDCISRQAVEDAIAEMIVNGESLGYAVAQDILSDLPSVTPQPKIGHWIRMKAYEKWGCSECHTVFRFTFKEHDYCPKCGAKMVEP